MSSMSDVESPSLIGQLLRTVGGWTTPSGKGLHMFRAMTFSVSCAGLSGVAAAFASSIFIGPVGAVAFAIGSSIGWIMASIYGWQSSFRHALVAFDSYPNLMVMHMVRSFRLMGLERIRLDSPEKIQEFRGRIMQEVQYKCMLVAAYETAQPMIDEIEARREAKLIAEMVGDE